MLKKLTLSTIVLSVLLLTACGGRGSKDINAGNNKNEYGYYGGTTKFGDYPATRVWIMFDNYSNILALALSDRGIYGISDGYENDRGVYGISGNTQTIKGSKLNNIHIIGTSNQTWKVDGQSVNCYNVSGGDRDIIMCPDKTFTEAINQKYLENIALRAYDSKIFSNISSGNIK